MAPSEEAAAWHAAVYQTVQRIPRGRVTSYGHIARLLGFPERPRQVGVALKQLPDAAAGLPLHNGNVPWQRVINSQGKISPRGVGGARRQGEALEAEDVEVGRTALGELTVDFSVYGWFPEPEGEDGEEDEEE